MAKAEELFSTAMENIYLQAKADINYNAVRFLQLISEIGGVKAARRLLAGTAAQSGLNRLWEDGRLDLSVEAHVLKPEFAELFTDDEREEARNRLEALGWSD